MKTNEKPIKCMICLNYVGVGKCKAYPNGIPKKFWDGKENHLRKREGQAGKFVFKGRV
jgi:hypothetical protein